MVNRRVQSNIKLFQVYIFLNRLEMWLPITVLFLLGKGLTLAQYAVLDVVWYVSTLVILASALGSILAGYLGGIDLALPIIATATMALLSCPLVLLFTEPQVADARSPGHLSHVRASVCYVLQHRLVALLILYSAVMGAAVWGLYILDGGPRSFRWARW